MIEIIGWASSLLLLATLIKQVHNNGAEAPAKAFQNGSSPAS